MASGRRSCVTAPLLATAHTLPFVLWRSNHPLDLMASVARYTRWGPDPTCVVSENSIARSFHLDDQIVSYQATQREGGVLELAATDEDAALEDLKWRLSESIPRGPIENLTSSDEILGSAYRIRPGYRPPLETDPFVSLVTSVSAQQVNLRWALTTRTRLIHEFSQPTEFAGRRLWPFPRPEQLAEAAVAQLRELQFTTRKSEYIIGIAAAALAGNLDGLAKADSEEVIERITSIRGAGRWTADWLLARCLGRPDAVAAGDLGVRKAVSFLYCSASELLSEVEVRNIADRWGDAANWATHLLLEELSAL